MNVLDHVVQSLRNAAVYNKHDAAPPSVILWTDGDRVWERVAARIGSCFGRFYQWSESLEPPHAGPSTWIRYQLTAEANREGTPIVYLPGISRQAFRTPAGLPDSARHLYALQFQGQFWTQLNAKDWTPAAMLASDAGGLGLDLAMDKATLAALAAQLGAVLDTEVVKLRRKRLEASDFHSLAVSDPPGMMLRWLADPAASEESWTEEQKAAFAGICRQEFQFDLKGEGRLGAAEKLVSGGGPWEAVWARFEEAPTHYRGVCDALNLVKPKDLFESVNLRLPETNRAAEAQLREGLGKLAGQPSAQARDALRKLVKTHQSRAATVWARLGEAPLAEATNHLGEMLEAMDAGFPGTTWDEIAGNYLVSAWKVDAEARRSFGGVHNQDDMAAITTALRSVYLPWLGQQAERLAPLQASYPNPKANTARVFELAPGTVYLFVDGLRTDLANELCQALGSSGFQTAVTPHWSALPSVTATAKPAWAPLTGVLCGEILPEGFEPQVAADHAELTTERFRKQIGELGLSYFENSSTGDPAGTGWTETADFDSRGHKEGAKLAWRIQEELTVVRHRVKELLQAGWKQVVIVTDHGWLWMPGGLEKAELPKHLTASKWGRCAVAKPGALHSLPTVPWFWGNEHHVVLAPGVSALKAGVEYSHGGLSIQETLIVSITVAGGGAAAASDVAILSSRWLGLRIQAEISGGGPDCLGDVRTKAADAGTSLLPDGAALPIRADGKFSALIEDESKEGLSAHFVVLKAGEVVCKQSVTVGEN